MAEGFPRFPMSTFQPLNHNISSSFQEENSPIPKTFQTVPHPSFLPRSDASTMNLRGQFPQMFQRGPDMIHQNVQSFPASLPQNQVRLQQNSQPPVMNMADVHRHPFPGGELNADISTNSSPNSDKYMHQNVQRFPASLPQNQVRLQQGSQPPAMNMAEVHRHPFPGGEFNANRSTNSNPNSFNFSAPVGFQFPADNTIHMDSRMSQPKNIPPAYPPSGETSRNNYMQPMTQVSVQHEKPPVMLFPGPFPRPLQGTLSLPPAPAPFPPSMAGPAQMMHLVPPPEFQALGGPLVRGQPEVTSQEWVNNFIKERNIERKENQATTGCGLKISEAKGCVTEWLQLICQLSFKRDKLAELAARQNEDEWRQELEKAQVLKARIEQIQADFSSPEQMRQLEEHVSKRRKKREWQKRRRKAEYELKKEAEERKIMLHQKIDERRAQIIAEHEAKRRADSMKSEAGGVLGEVKRKQADATRAVELLKSLRKLRDARKQEAEVKGVYQKPSEEDNKRFNERVSWLEDIMVRRRELYEAEERTLKVMLAEEEEEKEKERREKERRNQASLGLSDPMDWFRSYYKQAEHSLQSLLHIRQHWDAFLVPETIPGASRIPDGFVTPVEPSSDVWAKALIDKG